jgi:hypothetical protein
MGSDESVCLVPNATTAFNGVPRGAALVVLLLAGCTSVAPSGSPILSSPRTTPATTSIQPTASLPIAIPTATATAPGFAWQRLASIETTRDLAGIAASSAGYVVIERPRTAWFSRDGHSWTKSVLPFKTSTSGRVTLNAWVNEIVGGPDGFVSVGSYDYLPCSQATGDGGPPPCARGPISWVSSDGLSWQSSLSGPIPSDGSKLPAYSELVSAWPAGGGWDAAVEARDSVVYHGNILLHSADGLAWTRLSAPPLPEGVSADRVYAHGGAASASGRRLVWQDYEEETGRVSLATSVDAQTWTEIPGIEGTGIFVRQALGPGGQAEGPWLLSGQAFSSGPRSYAWFSSDLATWRRTSLIAAEGDADILWVERGGGGYIALGVYYDADGGMIPTTWLSSDGTTWAEVAAPSSPADGPVHLAAGPAGLIGIGGGTADDVGSTIWLGTSPGT